MSIHGESSGQLNIHVPYAFEFATATAREAGTGYTLVSADIGKLAKQTDDGSIWMLTATTPTWLLISGPYNNIASKLYLNETFS